MKEISSWAAGRVAVLLVLLVLPLASCATYRARPIHPEDTARALAGRRLSNPRLLRFIQVEERRAGPPRWNLKTLTLVATYERPDMRLATAQLGVAKAREIIAAELPNPTLSLQPSYDTTTTVPSPWKVGPVVSFLIQSLGERRALKARARAQAEAARQAIAITAWQLRGTVRTALLRLWSAKRTVSLSAQRRALASQYQSALAQRYRAGMVSAAILNSATLAQEQAQLGLSADQRTLRLARAGLATGLGLPVRALRGVHLDMAGISRPREPGELGPLIHAALIRRPDVLVALARYRAAEAELKLAIAQQYPSLDIGPGYRYDQGDNKFILAVSLPLPILNQNQGRIAEARAARHLAAERFLAVQARVLAQIERAQADWRASVAELANARHVRASAAEMQGRRRVEFAAGQIGRLRLLGAEEAFVQAERGALTASVDDRDALGKLEAALYHPFLVPAESR